MGLPQKLDDFIMDTLFQKTWMILGYPDFRTPPNEAGDGVGDNQYIIVHNSTIRTEMQSRFKHRSTHSNCIYIYIHISIIHHYWRIFMNIHHIYSIKVQHFPPKDPRIRRLAVSECAMTSARAMRRFHTAGSLGPCSATLTSRCGQLGLSLVKH